MIETGRATITASRSDFNTDVGSSSGGPSNLLVLNVGAKTCYIGGPAVTDPTGAKPGFEVAAGGSWGDDNVGPNDVYAVCATGDTTTLSWIYTRNG